MDKKMPAGFIFISAILGIVISAAFYVYMLYRHAIFGRTNTVIVANFVVCATLLLLADAMTREIFVLLKIFDASQQKLFVEIWLVVSSVLTAVIVITRRKRNSP